MKKSYFVTWVGALSTLFVTFLSVFRKVKKYGQKIHSKQKPNIYKIVELINKGIDFGLEKLYNK